MTVRSPEPQRQRERWQRSLGPRISTASLVLIGIVIGFAASLYFAWIVQPVSFTEASPARLSDDHRAEYILLVSQAFEVNGDWSLAQERLAALADDQIRQTVSDQLAAYLRQGEPAQDLRSLALLARQLGVENAAVEAFVPREPGAPGEPAPVDTSAATPTLRPEAFGPTPSPISTVQPSPTPTDTPVPSPTAVPVYRLLSKEPVCEPDAPVRRLEVVAVDSSLEPLPGAEIIVLWDEGNDHFFTGFQPERGLGYGDFEMEPEVEYTAMMAEGSQMVAGISVILCEEDQGGQPGGWRLTFQNSDVQQ